MKHLHLISVRVSLVLVALITCLPMAAAAADEPPPLSDTSTLAPLLITEVQPGSAASASEEFIELYNTTSQSIDLSAFGWQLEVASSTATSWDNPFRTIALSGTIGAGQYYLVASQFSSGGQTAHYLNGVAQAWFSAGISATAGHIRLTYATNQLQSDQTCSLTATVVDQVEWSTPKNGQAAIPSLDGRTVLVTASSSGVAKTTSLQRIADPLATGYRDSNNDNLDWVPAPATIGAPSVISTTSTTEVGMPATTPALPQDNCDPNPPAGSDPSPGQTPPLLPPSDSPPVDNSAADGNQSPPAEGSGNADPIASPAENSGLLAPQLSELLPNPAAPLSDADGEFIELYNPNMVAFDLSGFQLQSGVTTVHTYIFPAGSSLAADSFAVWYTAETKLPLANSDGQVQLRDPAGNLLAQSGDYGAAKEGQAWVFADNRWQWTTTATPGRVNIVTAPPLAIAAVKAAKTTSAAAKKPAAVKATASKTTKKTAKSSTSTAKKLKPTTSADTKLVSAALPPRQPLRVGLLAAIGGFALLYGAYEYRHDAARKIHQFRSNRAARRAHRATTQGR